MIAIIDYGAGNLRSVKKAFDFLDVDSHFVTRPDEILRSKKLVLPGVGAFGAAMKKLEERNLINPIREWIDSNKPFLGICLGLQLLCEKSSESPGVSGLSSISGDCRRFQSGKVPQIGWNQVSIKKKSPLFNGIKNSQYFYFLHGYYIMPSEPEVIIGETDYTITYPSVISVGRVYAVQFHPEKSGDVGLTLLKNWVELC